MLKKYSVSNLVVLLTGALALYQYVSSMIRHSISLVDYLKRFKYFKEFMTLDNETVQMSDTTFLFEQSISFENVSFSYEDRIAVQNVSFVMPRGSSVAIIGPNGSGKSTLIKLLLGYYLPFSGEILVDSTNLLINMYSPTSGEIKINNIDLSKYRISDKILSIMPQQYNMYNSSLSDNVTMGNVEFTKEMVEDALVKAFGGDFLEQLPNGLDSSLGGDTDEGAIGLSTGEMQRVAIARMLVNQSKLIIMDEPTATIDPVFEKKIVNEIINWARGKTCIVFTHRLEITQCVDRIIVMDNGQIVESGSFSELSEKNTIFRDMYKHQKGENEKNI